MAWKLNTQLLINYGAKILFSLVILIAAYYLINFTAKSLQKILNNLEVQKTIITLLIDLFKFIFWILTLAIVLNYLGLKEISLTLGGSIAVLALGLSKSITNVASDLLAGIFLLADEDFKVGSKVEINGIEGTVVSLSVRKTKIRDQEGKLHIISNDKVDRGILIIQNDEKAS